MKIRSLYFVTVLLFAVCDLVASDKMSKLYDADSYLVDPSVNYEKKSVDPQEYFGHPKESKEKQDNSFFEQTKSCVTSACNPTSFLVAGPVIYYPVAALPYAVVYAMKCAWLKMHNSEDIQVTKGKKQQVSNKDRKAKDSSLFNKILQIDEKMDLFVEELAQQIAKGIRYIKRSATFSSVPTKYVVSDKKDDCKPDMLSVRCQQWTSAIFAGLFTFVLLKITDKVLRSGKFGIVGEKYALYQNRYDAVRVLVTNRCWSKMVRLLNKCIPNNAYIFYQYPTHGIKLY